MIKKDLLLQEKHFTDKLSAVPEKWIKEAEEMKNRGVKHKFSIENIKEVPIETMQSF